MDKIKIDWNATNDGRYQYLRVGKSLAIVTRDPCPSSPTDLMDLPMIGAQTRRLRDKVELIVDDSTTPRQITHPQGLVSPELLQHMQVHIAKILGDVTLADVYPSGRNYSTDPDDLDELANEFEASTFDLDQIEAVYRDVLGWSAHRIVKHGYCQGDIVDVLVILTPGIQDKHGWSAEQRADPEFLAAQAEAQASTYASWVFGDVYGCAVYELTESEMDDFEADEQQLIASISNQGQPQESCFGFYGGDHSDSGLDAFALDALTYAGVKAQLVAA